MGELSHEAEVIAKRLTRTRYPEIRFEPVCSCGWIGDRHESRFEAEGAAEKHRQQATASTRSA